MPWTSWSWSTSPLSQAASSWPESLGSSAWDRHLADYKLLAVPQSDPLFDEYTELKNVPRHFLREVENFFATYKHLEGNTVVAQGWDDATAAMTELEACIERFAHSARAHENVRES